MDFKYKQIGENISILGNILEQILKKRGVNNVSEFLNLSEKNLEDYNLYDNLKVGVVTLLNHLKLNSKIAILVDYDTDGYTSGSELYLYIKDICNHLKLNFNVQYIIHTTKEHGLSKNIMDKIRTMDIDLLIIPDASSNDFKQHDELSKSMTVLVLDHHQCNKYSDSAIVINNQMSQNVKNKAMTGVGVVFKFITAIDDMLNVKFADKYLDLVAIGMIGDSADLRDLESRYLVMKGLDLIQKGANTNKFISTIFKHKSFSMNSKVTISNVAFYMCPFINCIIRGGSEEDKELLFKAFIGDTGIYEDKIRGKGIVQMGIEDYMVRRYTKLYKLQTKATTEGVMLLDNQIDKFNLNKNEIIVLNGSEIATSEYNRVIVNKVSSKYQKHCILLKKYNDNEFRGSATGYKNKDITDFRQWCINSKLFTFAEGHKSAFGLGIHKNKINELYNYISQIPSSDSLYYNVDGIFNENTLNPNIVNSIGKYDYIWGNKLDEPLFAMEITVNSKDIVLLGKSKNTIKFIHNGIEFVKFNTNEDTYVKMIKNNANKITIIGKFKVNEYHNITTPQVVIEDFKFEETEVVKPFAFI